MVVNSIFLNQGNWSRTLAGECLAEEWEKIPDLKLFPSQSFLCPSPAATCLKPVGVENAAGSDPRPFVRWDFGLEDPILTALKNAVCFSAFHAADTFGFDWAMPLDMT
jgi:hypothetical protein